MTTAKITEKQRQAIEAMERARSEGIALSKYAKAHGLIIRELYDAIACLRRKGLLAKPTRRAGSKFVAVRVMTPSEPTQALVSKSASGVLCRVVNPRGLMIECMQWPPSEWLAALTAGCADVAT
jgi:hypothetical protein